jgi:3-oxochol-4-en-24-oyl-CoA dehydrogenase
MAAARDHLADVSVPGDRMVGEINKGWKIATTTLANDRVSLSGSWTFGNNVPALLQVVNTIATLPLRAVGDPVAEGQAISLLAVRAAPSSSLGH